MGRAATPVEQRFWNYVEQGDPNECWPWTGATTNDYGVIRDDAPSSKMVRATHVSLRIDGRNVGLGEMALHTCDNPPCVNPNHLFVGSNNDNMKDKVTKGRSIGRATTGGSHLSEADVLEIRRRCALGESSRSIAADYSISSPHVINIKNRKTWKHI